MTREEFIEVLEEKEYSYYTIEGDKIVINRNGPVFLAAPTSLPPNVEFRNAGYVDLASVTSLPSGVKFNNGDYVDLASVTSIHPSVEFNGGGEVYLKSLIGKATAFRTWKGNIYGIDSNRLLNKMIKGGVFER